MAIFGGTSDNDVEMTRIQAQSRVDAAKAAADGRAKEAEWMSQARTAEATAMAEARTTEANDRRDAMIHVSDNRLAEAKDRDATMTLSIMQNSRDFQFQVTAWLMAQTESLSTKVQIAMKDAEVRLHQIDSDERVEEKRIKNEGREIDLREQEIKNAGKVSSQSILV